MFSGSRLVHLECADCRAERSEGIAGERQASLAPVLLSCQMAGRKQAGRAGNARVRPRGFAQSDGLGGLRCLGRTSCLLGRGPGSPSVHRNTADH